MNTNEGPWPDEAKTDGTLPGVLEASRRGLISVWSVEQSAAAWRSNRNYYRRKGHARDQEYAHRAMVALFEEANRRRAAIAGDPK